MVSTLLSFGTMLEDTRRYFANFDGLTNTCRTIALWISLALVIAFAITKIYPLILGKVSKNYNEDQIKAALPIINGIWIVIALTFATALIVTFLTCYFVEVAAGEESLVPILFYPGSSLSHVGLLIGVGFLFALLRIVNIQDVSSKKRHFFF